MGRFCNSPEHAKIQLGDGPGRRIKPSGINSVKVQQLLNQIIKSIIKSDYVL